MKIDWKTGFEIELMTPAGTTREDFARRIAARTGGKVERFFHPQSEPSKVPGKAAFENLTFGFHVFDADGKRVADLVDDITLNEGLNRNAPPKGWYRIVGDDARLLRLVTLHCSPDAPLRDVLDPLASLFGTKTDRHPSGMVKVADDRNVSIALAAAMPGERERPCEIITPPLEHDHAGYLRALMQDAVEAGCTVPAEAASHIHFDAARLKDAQVFANLVKVLDRHGPALKKLLATNPRCTRLGPWPKQLIRLVNSDDFIWMNWDAAVEALRPLPLTKYCDFNLMNMVHDHRSKPTFEVRILPVSLDPEALIAATALFEGILNWCVKTPATGAVVPATLKDLVEAVPLGGEARGYWSAKTSG